MNIYSSMTEFEILNTQCGDYFFKEEKAKMIVNRSGISFVDLTNANKSGKLCNGLFIRPAFLSNTSVEVILHTWMKENAKNLADLYEEFCSDNLDFLEDDIRISLSEKKGVRVYSPFVVQKEIKEPKEWTIGHVVKALYANQIIYGKTVMKTSDDYSRDALENFGKGKICLPDFTKCIVENRSGWYVNKVSDSPLQEVIKLSVSRGTHDIKMLYFLKG